MQKPRIPPHPTTKQEILFLRRMGFPAQKKMKTYTQDCLFSNSFFAHLKRNKNNYKKIRKNITSR